METKHLIKIGILAIISTIIFFSFTGNETLDKGTLPENYEEKIRKKRQETDTFFKTDEKSPISKEERADFKGLKHYNVASDYYIVARMEKIKNGKKVSMQTSKHEEKFYIPYAKAYFELKNTKCELTIYKSAKQDDYLFLPFTDLSTGKESYGAGRYIEVEELSNKQVLIDFNLAYNPYCAYSDKYNCPYPPAENDLSIKIEAGEKVYH
jgi:uncharacterized protein (DUF1684 family)